MFSYFNYFPSIHDDYLVGIPDGTQPMRNDNNSSIFKKTIQICRNLTFVLSIQRVCRFIKEQIVRILIYCPCYKNTLRLTFA